MIHKMSWLPWGRRRTPRSCQSCKSCRILSEWLSTQEGSSSPFYRRGRRRGIGRCGLEPRLPAGKELFTIDDVASIERVEALLNLRLEPSASLVEHVGGKLGLLCRREAFGQPLFEQPPAFGPFEQPQALAEWYRPVATRVWTNCSNSGVIETFMLVRIGMPKLSHAKPPVSIFDTEATPAAPAALLTGPPSATACKNLPINAAPLWARCGADSNAPRTVPFPH